MFNNSNKVKKLLQNIKQYKIHYELITILYIPVLVTFVMLAHNMGYLSYAGKINLGVQVGLVGAGLVVVVLVMCLELGGVGRKWGKLGRLRKEEKNRKLIVFYRSRILLNTCDGLSFIIIPATIGLYNAYTCLSITLCLLLLKLLLCILCLKNKPSFYQFLWFLSILFELMIVLTYFIAHIISGFSTIPPEIEIPWLSFIRYSSLALPFLYITVAFFYSVMMYWEFSYGFYIAWNELRCGNRVANTHVVGNEIVVEMGK
jgi:hypothetical protein